MSLVLVTGAAGFIGSHVVKHLLKKDCNIVAVDDLSGGFRENLPRESENFHFVKMDVSDSSEVEKLFNLGKFEYIYHLAAYAAEGLSHFIRRFNYNNNLIGSVNLINGAVKQKAKCFVFTSSIAVYGTPIHLPVDELTPCKPEDPYGIAKYAIELDLKAAYEMFGLRSIIFRPHNVYGLNQNIGDKYRNVIGIFINQCMKGEPLTIFGDGNQTRAFSHIDDVAPYIAEAPFNRGVYGRTFNIGADIPYTIKALAKEVLDQFGTKNKLRFLPPRNEVKHVHADHSLVKRFFDMKESISLKDGIKEMVEWAKEHGSRESAKFKNIEIEENLPESWR